MAWIKIFNMNDYDWYAAETVEDALKEMAETLSCGTDPDDIAEMRREYQVKNPVELTDEDMDRLKYIDTDENDDPEGDPRTFREQLAKMISEGDKFPCMFASTEY